MGEVADYLGWLRFLWLVLGSTALVAVGLLVWKVKTEIYLRQTVKRVELQEAVTAALEERLRISEQGSTERLATHEKECAERWGEVKATLQSLDHRLDRANCDS